MIEILINIIKVVLIIVSVLLGVAFMTIAERKYLSGIQRRRGPNVIGFFGLLQAIGDGLKLIVKETTKPTSADTGVFLLAPVISFGVSLACWGVLPISEGVVLADINIGIIYILAISSLGVYGVLLGGYSSNSKYGFFGGIRSSAQMISYEVSIGFVIGTVVIFSGGSLNLSEIVLSQEGSWNMIGLLPMFIIFVISILAETNRHPFDLPEAESELVSGYNVEYSAGGFALFFLGEYSSIILMSGLCTIMFLGGWLLIDLGTVFGILVFSVKTFLMICLFIWARAAYPRYRYDQLIELGWVSFLPLSLSWVLLVVGISYIS